MIIPSCTIEFWLSVLPVTHPFGQDLTVAVSKQFSDCTFGQLLVAARLVFRSQCGRGVLKFETVPLCDWHRCGVHFLNKVVHFLQKLGSFTL